MNRTTRDIVIVLIIFMLGFLTAYYFYGLQKWPCFPASVTASTISTIPLFDENYASSLISEINSAQTSIDMAMFEFKFYETEKNEAHKILDALVNARQRNVSIRILLDSSDWNEDITNENKQTLQYLENAGINAKFDNPKRTLHSKVIIIDDSVFVGSHNLVFSALERNNEASILIKNEDVTDQYKNYFEWLWGQS